MPNALLEIYENILLFKYCKIYNNLPNIIIIESTTKGFATDKEVHYIDLLLNRCSECDYA